jgi:hypothetical protein
MLNHDSQAMTACSFARHCAAKESKLKGLEESFHQHREALSSHQQQASFSSHTCLSTIPSPLWIYSQESLSCLQATISTTQETESGERTVVAGRTQASVRGETTNAASALASLRAALTAATPLLTPSAMENLKDSFKTIIKPSLSTQPTMQQENSKNEFLFRADGEQTAAVSQHDKGSAPEEYAENKEHDSITAARNACKTSSPAFQVLACAVGLPFPCRKWCSPAMCCVLAGGQRLLPSKKQATKLPLSHTNRQSNTSQSSNNTQEGGLDDHPQQSRMDTES